MQKIALMRVDGFCPDCGVPTFMYFGVNDSPKNWRQYVPAIMDFLADYLEKNISVELRKEMHGLVHLPTIGRLQQRGYHHYYRQLAEKLIGEDDITLVGSWIGVHLSCARRGVNQLWFEQAYIETLMELARERQGRYDLYDKTQWYPGCRVTQETIGYPRDLTNWV